MTVMKTNLAEYRHVKEGQKRLSGGCKRKTVYDQKYRHRKGAESQTGLNKLNDNVRQRLLLGEGWLKEA